MTSRAAQLIEDMANTKKHQCVLAYTLTDSECARTTLENNLEADGWEKPGHKMETLWMAEKPASEFMSWDAGVWQFDESKIDEKFRDYFAEVDKDCEVEADFVLVICNGGKCAVKFTKAKGTMRYRITIDELD